MDSLIELDDAIRENTKEQAGLQWIIDSIVDNGSELKEVSHQIKAKSKVEKLLDLSKEIEHIGDDIIFFKNSIDSLNLRKERLSTLKEEITALHEQYDALMPDICPLCDQPIKKKGHNHGKRRRTN